MHINVFFFIHPMAIDLPKSLKNFPRHKNLSAILYHKMGMNNLRTSRGYIKGNSKVIADSWQVVEITTTRSSNAV